MKTKFLKKLIAIIAIGCLGVLPLFAETLTITNDMLNSRISVSMPEVGELKIVVIPKEGVALTEIPHWGVAQNPYGHLSGFFWEYSVLPGDYSISYAGTSTKITVTPYAPPATTYTLTVNNGSGSGNYEAGTVVPITANAPPSGQEFDQWTGSTSGVADVNSASTTFTMGSENASVTATYKALPPTTYTLTVNNGSGSGNYEAGTVVNISANTAPSGQTFDKWTGNTSGIADVNSSSTTFTMGSENASVTATYKALPVVTHTVTFDPANGSSTWTVTVNDGQTVSKPGDPSKNGYAFQGWYNGSVAFDFNAAITSDLTLTAKWEQNVVPQPSSDATLSGLSLGAGISLNPAFNPNVTSYTAAVANSVSSLTVTASANDGGATLSGTGTYPLAVGENTITIVVTAEDGTARTYTIIVTRADNPSGIESTDTPAVSVWAGNGVLKITSPQEEDICVYSISGALIYKTGKLPGEASFTVSLPKGVLIVRAGTGWARKVIND
jgi:uncharacterized repeat protein (TIGR02543 family)